MQPAVCNQVASAIVGDTLRRPDLGSLKEVFPEYLPNISEAFIFKYTAHLA